MQVSIFLSPYVDICIHTYTQRRPYSTAGSSLLELWPAAASGRHDGFAPLGAEIIACLPGFGDREVVIVSGLTRDIGFHTVAI